MDLTIASKVSKLKFKQATNNFTPLLVFKFKVISSIVLSHQQQEL
jgi:TRAP-type C4-dicarboxylate transport system permease large subunit